MRHIAILACLVIVAFACPAHASDKALVVVFSRADENYNVGVVEKGNTMIVAEEIVRATGADLFEIRPVEPYPKGYRDCTDVVKREQAQGARPAMVKDVDISSYDTIFLGHPIWWGDLPMIVYTFIEAHDWSGKTVAPFCTHEGSGLSGTVGTLRRVLSGATVRDGLAIQGTTAQGSPGEMSSSVASWLDGLGL